MKSIGFTDLKLVVIQTDSDYLVKCMTQSLRKWKSNKFRNAKGKPVVNQELFEEIDNRIMKLNARGTRYVFLHVPRSKNKEADRLANEALDDEE